MSSVDETILETSPTDLWVSPTEMANAIRFLTMDTIEHTQSGHPGMPLGMADAATVLFTRFLKFDAQRPDWPDRDRFVLSAGHGSMLLYSLLYLTGYAEASLDTIKAFRSVGSKTPGHPEYGHLAGVEATTGPLGQGLGMAVGMAFAERLLAARFGSDLVDHRTYAVAGDGCLMEGISQEAIGLAAHWGLSKLTVVFDDNQIITDGPTSVATSEDQVKRFEAAGWHALRVDGHEPEAVAAAFEEAQEVDRPSLIACRTRIARGAPTKEGSNLTHVGPLGPEEVASAREKLGWPYSPFEIPETVLSAWRRAGVRGAAQRQAWEERLAAAKPGDQSEFERLSRGELPADWDRELQNLKKNLAEEPQSQPTRIFSGMAVKAIADCVPEIVAGSCDLTGANQTMQEGMAPITAKDFSGRHIFYGIREHGMAAMMNGMALHRGVVPVGGSFLVFTDYFRASIRLSALMGVRVIYVMTHDSIRIGQDGPTHQPVEQLAGLRAMPNLHVFRPADGVETTECWELAMKAERTPSVLSLTRLDVPPQRTAHSEENLCARGAYVLAEAEGEARATLLATGSEVLIAMAAREQLQAEGVPTRVVSMPCWSLFEAQDAEYRRAVLAPETVRVGVEAASPMGWDRYIGPEGGFVGVARFGASGPTPDVMAHLGITPDAVVEAVKARL